jgi:hypothetical protein
VKKVGNEDNFIQIQENNQKNLLDVLEGMIVSFLGMSPNEVFIIKAQIFYFFIKIQLDLTDDHIRILNECDLTVQFKVDKCVQAANLLIKSIDSNVPVGLMKMKAFEDQKKFLENLKLKFSASASAFIKSTIQRKFSDHLKTYNIFEGSLNYLPSHKQIYDELIIYKEVIPWLYKSCIYYNQHNNMKNFYDEVKNVSHYGPLVDS